MDTYNYFLIHYLTRGQINSTPRYVKLTNKPFSLKI